MTMIRSSGHVLACDDAPLRSAVAGKKARYACIVAVLGVHLVAGAWLWHSPLSSPPALPAPIVVQLASMTPPAALKESAATPAVPPPSRPAAPARSQKKPPSSSSTPSTPAKKAQGTRTVKPAASTSAVAPPPSGDMLGEALASVHQQGWQATSQRYAEDGASNVQAALARYRLDWVRATQTYVDLHFPKTRRDARLTFDVTVDRRGRLLGLDMVHSTGDAALDAQAFKAIRAAAPFRPFDAGMGNRQTLTFRQGWIFNQGALLEL